MNIIFHASAGTGKTYQVTNLYVHMVLGRRYETRAADGSTVCIFDPAGREGGPCVDPRRILLMTFTDNAAAELRTRVTQLVLKARHDAERAGNDEDFRQCASVLQSLPSAQICTIHSFCSGLLRERALEAGIPPGFAVLDQEQTSTLLDDASREELLARLNPPSAGTPAPESPYDPDFAAFCHNVRVLGGEYASSLVDITRALLGQAASRGVDLATAEALLPPPVHTITRADFERLLEDFKRARSNRKDGKLPSTAAVVFQSLEKLLGGFSKDWKTEELEAFARELKNAGTTVRGTGLEAINKELKRLVSTVLETAAYRVHFPSIRAFARYLAGVAARYAERKKQAGGLDFEDLLTRTRDVLRDLPAAHALYDYVIIDEVQDTSRVQCDILMNLWDPASNHLVICGDTKQSIYAWRNADPKVMPDLEHHIARTKRHHHIALRASFRSKDVLLDVVNRMFEIVYGEAYTEDERLTPAAEKKAVVAAKERPCFEFLTGDTATAQSDADKDEGSDDEADEPDLDSQQRVNLEMTSIARRILLLVNGPAEFRPRFRYDEVAGIFKPTNEENVYRYADILILLRRTTQQQVLEHVLRQHGIPYRIGGRGTGLFTQPEAKDILLFLRALTHPIDAINMVGFLRSPWVGLSDESIDRLGWHDARFDEPRLRSFASDEGKLDMSKLDLAPEQAERLALARALLRMYRAQCDARLPSDLLRDLIAQTGYDAVLAGAFRGGQRLANLKKLIDWLRQAERGGTVLIADVVELLQRYIDDPPPIAEAALLDPDQNVVTIMTVHGAKGLTARVVFVPELSARLPADTAWALLAQSGDDTARLCVKTEDIRRGAVLSPGFTDARTAMADVRSAESRNVFYVALTRARDLVVLSGDSSAKKLPEWRSYLQQFITDTPERDKLLTSRSHGELEAAVNTHLPGAAQRPSRRQLPTPAHFAAATERFPAPLPRARVLRYPATTLSAYHSDPSGYVKTALPESEPFWVNQARSPDASEAGEQTPRIPGDQDVAGTYAEFGTAGHAVFEQLALHGWHGDLHALAKTAWEGSPSRADIRDLLTRLERAVPILQRAAAGATALQAEWPFAMTLKSDDVTLIVDGTMDLLFRSPNGRWQVMDYKFTEEPADHLVARYGLQLNLYLEALRRGVPGGDAADAFMVAVRRNSVEFIPVPADNTCAGSAVAAALNLDRIAGSVRV